MGQPAGVESKGLCFASSVELHPEEEPYITTQMGKEARTAMDTEGGQEGSRVVSHVKWCFEPVEGHSCTQGLWLPSVKYSSFPEEQQGPPITRRLATEHWQISWNSV